MSATDKKVELIKHCSIGELEFDLIVNRCIARDLFVKHSDLWKAVVSQKGDDTQFDDEDIVDIDKYIEYTDRFSSYQDLLPAFVEDAIAMTLQDCGISAKQIISYCVENEVDDIVNLEIFKFIMLGFSEGRTQKSPKVKVAFK